MKTFLQILVLIAVLAGAVSGARAEGVTLFFVSGPPAPANPQNGQFVFNCTVQNIPAQPDLADKRFLARLTSGGYTHYHLLEGPVGNLFDPYFPLALGSQTLELVICPVEDPSRVVYRREFKFRVVEHPASRPGSPYYPVVPTHHEIRLAENRGEGNVGFYEWQRRSRMLGQFPAGTTARQQADLLFEDRVLALQSITTALTQVGRRYVYWLQPEKALACFEQAAAIHEEESQRLRHPTRPNARWELVPGVHDPLFMRDLAEFYTRYHQLDKALHWAEARMRFCEFAAANSTDASERRRHGHGLSAALNGVAKIHLVLKGDLKAWEQWTARAEEAINKYVRN